MIEGFTPKSELLFLRNVSPDPPVDAADADAGDTAVDTATEALGLALRASGHEMRSYVGQFMKGQPYGELEALRDHPWVTVEQYGDVRCIRREEVTPEHVAQAHRAG